MRHGQQRPCGNLRLGQMDGRQPQVGSGAAGRGMLRFIQFVGLVFGVIVVEFLQQLLGLIVIKRQFIRFQQRIIQFLRLVVGIVLVVGQQFVRIFEQRFVER